MFYGDAKGAKIMEEPVNAAIVDPPAPLALDQCAQNFYWPVRRNDDFLTTCQSVQKAGANPIELICKTPGQCHRSVKNESHQ